MSHACVFEFGDAPFKEDEYLLAEELYDYEYATLFMAMSDYAADLTSEARSDVIDMLVEGSNGGLVREGDKLTLVSKKQLLIGRYRKFKTAVINAASITADEYCSSNGWFEKCFPVEEACIDRTWVRTDDNGTEGFVKFIRRHKDGDAFYVGGVIDYHY